MKNFGKTFLFTSVILININLFAQEITQTIRGTVVDKQTQIPLPGASVVLLNSNPLQGTTTDLDGNFVLERVPLHRQSIQISYMGYISITKDNLIVSSGKELVLDIELEESIITTEVVEVVATEKYEPINTSATVSARTFTVEETERYAGSWLDPARMATNFAGVNAANDKRNDIVIRGNSPTGLLWRLEEVNIPNPNHFATNGTTGGAVSILNNNNLSNSDFFTGAFPAQYGNALAGAFDLNLRKGNNQKHEFMAELAVFGLQFGAEGPLSKEKKGSYIFNYRYSTLGLYDDLGLGGNSIPSIPKYQDITFKIDLGRYEKLGNFSIFGIGGLSHMDYKYIDEGDDGDYDIHDENENSNFYMTSDMGVVGLSHLKIISSNSYIKSALAYTGTNRGSVSDTILSDNSTKIISANRSAEQKLIWSSLYNYKINVKNNFRIGFSYEYVFHSAADSTFIRGSDTYQTLLDVDGSYSFAQVYGEWQHKFSDNLILNTGLYAQLLLMNKTWSAEPRFGLKWNINNKNTLNLGAGLHSQIQSMPLYLYETQLNNNEYIRTNENLDMTKSIHLVAGYKFMAGNNFLVKIEPYYQYLYNVPVEKNATYFSALNIGGDFLIPVVNSLENTGTGRNYGIDLTLEKFYANNYYFLITGSLYESKATGSDGIERNTLFNGNFSLNVLGGYEFKVGKNSALSIDGKVTYLGNRRYIPIDFEASKNSGYTVYINKNAYENRYKDFFRLDLKLSLRWNRKRLTHKIMFDITNILNTENVYKQVYNPKTDGISSMYTYGTMPNFIYRIEF